MWNESVLHWPAEHARFVLYKGDARAADTLLPAPQLIGRLRAEITLDHTTAVARAGASFTDRLRVRNTGSVIWKSQGRRFGGQVTCGLKICDVEGNVLREDLGRTPLPHDIAPNAALEIDMRIDGMLPPGDYQLRYDMVVEGVTWFEYQDSPCARRGLRIDP